MRHDVRGRHGEQPVESLALRQIDRVLATLVQQVEEHRHDRELGAQRLDVEPAAEPPHRDLERMGAAVGGERDRLAVEHEAPCGQCAHELDDLRHRGRHLVQQPRKHAHVVVRLVDLNARAVELVLERRPAEPLDRLVDRVRGLREHRRDRSEQLEPEAIERVRSLDQRGMRDTAEIAGEHRGALDALDGDSRGGRDGLVHESRERTLAQLAREQPAEEVTLVCVGAAKQMPQRARAQRQRAAPGQRRDAPEARIDIGERQRRAMRTLARRPEHRLVERRLDRAARRALCRTRPR
jgi:hypothetical protein